MSLSVRQMKLNQIILCTALTPIPETGVRLVVHDRPEQKSSVRTDRSRPGSSAMESIPEAHDDSWTHDWDEDRLTFRCHHEGSPTTASERSRVSRIAEGKAARDWVGPEIRLNDWKVAGGGRAEAKLAQYGTDPNFCMVPNSAEVKFFFKLLCFFLKR